MRLIDADALLDATRNFCDGYKVNWTDNKVLSWIDHASTIDAVPVVRCKDCKHCNPTDGGSPLCTYHRIACSYNDFCSYGERKDGAEDG